MNIFSDGCKPEVTLLMKITDKIHQIRIDFKVGPELERFVYMYVLVGENVHLIDTGVDGSDQTLREYLKENKIGSPEADVKTILLTHTHPDHIGSAAEIMKYSSGCRIYGSAEEREWVENIDKQFEDRPIPDFYKLINKSARLSGTIKDGDVLKLEDGMTIHVIESKGHSDGSLSFYWAEERALFTGDAIPVAGDIPIFTDRKKSVETLEKLKQYPNVDLYLSAWDDVYDSETAPQKIDAAVDKMEKIKAAVTEEIQKNKDGDRETVYRAVCKNLNLEGLVQNPLFIRSVFVTMDEVRNE